MLGHGSLSPVLLSVLLVPLFVLGLPRRRLAGLATHILFRMLAFVLRLRIVVLLLPLQQSRPARFNSPRLRNPTSGASPLWPAAEHPSNPCSPLKMRMTSPSLRSPCARDIVKIRPRKACRYPNLRSFGRVSYDRLAVYIRGS